MASEENLPTEPSSPSKKVLLDQTQYAVIHNEAQEEGMPTLECQFEDALEEGYILIVVEPAGLGDNCIKWIRVGNFLHKTAVLAAIGTVAIHPFIKPRLSLVTTVPLGTLGICCACLYGFSWQFDPCSKYQVDYRGRELARIPSHEIHTPSPVVLIRRNDRYRKILHNTLSVMVVSYLGFTLYKHFCS